MQAKEKWIQNFEHIKNICDYPSEIHVSIEKSQLIQTCKLWEYPHLQKFGGYVPNELPAQNMKALLTRDLHEINFQVEYSLRNQSRSFKGVTYLLTPQQYADEQLFCPLLSYCTGSMNGVQPFISEDYFKDPEQSFNNSIEALGIFYLSYYFQLPVHIICKGIGKKFWKTEGSGDQDPWGAMSTYITASREASKIWLKENKHPVSFGRGLAGGISRGSFNALLLSSFNHDISHTFLVHGPDTLKNFSEPGAKKVNCFARPDLLEKGIDMDDWYAITPSKLKVSFALNDGHVRPRHFWTLQKANQKRISYNLESISVQSHHLELGRYGHTWPIVESINFFADALLN